MCLLILFQEYVAETIEVKVEEFNTLKENSAPLLQKYPPSDWLEGKMKEITDKWDALWKCCGDHQSHLGKILNKNICIHDPPCIVL